jgi:hypothetical protein
VIFGESVGIAESGLALAFVSSNTNFLGTLVAFVGFLLNWLSFLFNNFNRLGFDGEDFLVDGDFMAYGRSIALSFTFGIINWSDNRLKLSGLFLALLFEAAGAKIIVSFVSKEFETAIAKLGSFRSFVGDLVGVIELIHDDFRLDWLSCWGVRW